MNVFSDGAVANQTPFSCTKPLPVGEAGFSARAAWFRAKRVDATAMEIAEGLVRTMTKGSFEKEGDG